jgi:hypothetical protein
VILVDRVADSIRIGRRACTSRERSGRHRPLVAMGVAAAVYLPPVSGALLQEAIDVGVILNALRALQDGRDHAWIACSAGPGTRWKPGRLS